MPILVRRGQASSEAGDCMGVGRRFRRFFGSGGAVERTSHDRFRRVSRPHEPGSSESVQQRVRAGYRMISRTLLSITTARRGTIIVPAAPLLLPIKRRDLQAKVQSGLQRSRSFGGSNELVCLLMIDVGVGAADRTALHRFNQLYVQGVNLASESP
jgi:hypothetical protein